MKQINEFHEKIDQDVGLNSKRKMLTITSLILLALQFSGAKVLEANTLILKLSFEHQGGIILLLTLSVLFLLIRYHNYAQPYHTLLYKTWSKQLINNNVINRYDPYDNEPSGLLHKVYPKGFNYDAIIHSENPNIKFSYLCKGFFFRYFCYEWSNQHEDCYGKVNICRSLGFINYLFILFVELQYQFGRYFTHRESLDILSPYFLGFFSLLSYFFIGEFQYFFKF